MPISKEKTFCPRLWNEVYIRNDGDVFVCCHDKPCKIGSIYSEKLKDIHNSEIIKNLRSKSLNGQLACFKQCTLLAKNDAFSSDMPISVDYNELKRIKILFGEACNINCLMCTQDHKSRVVLDHEKLIENIDLSPFEKIDIQGGEPLFIQSARKFFDHASSKNKKVSFLTNGLLINEEWAEKIAKNSEHIYFSLNAATKYCHEKINKGSNWEKVLGNIEKVRKAREKLQSNLRIHGHMTIVLENITEIAFFIKEFKNFGFDSIDFGYDGLSIPRYLKLHPIKAMLLRRQIRISLASLGADISRVTLLRLKILGLCN